MTTQCIGTISFHPDPQPITLDMWTELVAQKKLVPMSSFSTLNPFTQEMCEISGGEAAALVIDDKTVGTLWWSANGHGIDAHSDGDDRMQTFVRELAAELEGDFEPIT